MVRMETVERKIFVGKTAEEVGVPAIFSDDNDNSLSYFGRHATLRLVNLPSGWNSERGGCSNYHNPMIGLCDSKGEVRRFSPLEAIKIASRFKDWASYDDAQREEKIALLERELEESKKDVKMRESEVSTLHADRSELQRLLAEVYDINRQGGPGSRKKVRELIASYIAICEQCGVALACDCD